MKRCSENCVVLLLVLALLGQGCAPRVEVRPDPVVEASPVPERPEWGPRWEPELLADVEGVTQDGQRRRHPRAFVLHRAEVEETLALRRTCGLEMEAASECERQLAEARADQTRGADRAWVGWVFGGVLGLLVGAGLATGIAYGVSR